MALTKAQMAEALFDELGLNKREARELVDSETTLRTAAKDPETGQLFVLEEPGTHADLIAKIDARRRRVSCGS